MQTNDPAKIYLFNIKKKDMKKVWNKFKNNNKNNRTTSLTQRRCSVAFIVNLEHISHLFLEPLLLTLNK